MTARCGASTPIRCGANDDTDTDCDYRVTADGRQLSFERNAPGEGDTVDIFFVILEG